MTDEDVVIGTPGSRRLLAGVDAGAVGVDTAGRITFWNAAAERLFGRSAAAALGSDVREVLRGEAVEAALRLALAGSAWTGEVAAGSGEEAGPTLSCVVSPVRGPDGEVVGALALATDGSALRRGEMALRRRHELYRTVLENVRDLIALVGGDGRIAYASPSHREVLGRGHEELIGHPLAELVHPDDFEPLQVEIERSAASGLPGALAVRLARAGGGWVETDATVSAVLGDDETLVLLTGRDAAAGRGEEGAREFRFLFDAALAAVPDAITVVGRDGSVHYANRPALALLGVESDDELLSLPAARVLAGFELLRPDGTPLPAEELPTRRVLAGEVDAAELEVRYRVRATGEERVSVVRALPVRDAAGGPTHALAVFHDVTARRLGEERLSFLAEASTLLGSSLDYEATLRSLSSLVVPRLADWYAVDIVENGALRRIEVSHHDPEKVALLRRLERIVRGPGAAARVAESGEPQLLRVTDELIEELFAGQPEVIEGLRRLGLRSSLVVPLVSRGRTLGALTLATSDSGRVYGPADLELAEELGRRAGAAVDNAHLYREVHRTAALLDTLFGTAPVGLAFLDIEQRFVRVNDTLAEIDGLPPEAHVGRRLRELLPDADSGAEERFRQVLETRRPLLDQDESGETPAAPGLRRHWRVSYYPIEGGGELLGVVVVVADVTEQARIEADRADLLVREQTARAEAEEAARTLQRLARVTEAALEHLSLQDLLDALLVRLVELLDADTAVILLRDDDDCLVVRASIGLEEEIRHSVPIPIGGGMAGRVAATRQSRLISELDEITLASPHLRLRGVHSLVVVPLVVEGEAIGVFHIGSVEPGRFTEADLRLLELVSDRIAIGINQAALYEAERRARAEAQDAEERLGFLAEASAVLGSSLEIDSTLARLAELIVPRLADWCAVHLAEGDGRIATLAIVHCDAERAVRAQQAAREHPLDPGATAGVPAVIRTGRGRLVPEIDEDLLERLARDRPGQEEGLRALLGGSAVSVPLVARGRALGALTLLATESGRRYGETDLLLAEELARRAAIAVDNALLYREAEDRGRAARILESVGDGVFLVDGEGVVRYWNRAAAAITGLPSETVLDRPVAEAVPGWKEIESLAPVGGPSESMPLQLPDRELWLSISGVALEEGTVYAFRDLTHERAIEHLRTEFVSTVSHELRTPLAAIYGAAMTLGRDDVDLDEEQQRSLLAIVTGEADRLARTVDDILWASRLDAGSLHVAAERCDPHELVAGVVAAQRAHLPPGIELELVDGGSLPEVTADPDKVRQVLVNLLDNAVKYSPDGGRVTVRVHARGAQVRFAVEDEGLGIPYADQRRIFDKFYRLDPNLTRGVGGTGLGLYISRELVRRMNGRIWVESEPGRGSTFTVELPIADADVDVF